MEHARRIADVAVSHVIVDDYEYRLRRRRIETPDHAKPLHTGEDLAGLQEVDRRCGVTTSPGTSRLSRHSLLDS
jgi:hypothetical protein